MSELRIGLVGLGRFGRLHAKVLSDLPACRIAAVCDPDPSARERAAEVAPGATVHASLDELLDAGGIDAVDLCSDESVHGEQALACLRRDLPVLVEKPLATTAAEAREIAAVADERGLPVVVGYVSRFDHRYALLHEAARDGRLGRVVSVSARRAFSREWFAGFGSRVHPVFESMIHDVDLALWYLDAPIARVYAQALASGAEGGEGRVPDVLSALLTTADGRLASLQSAWLAPAGATRNLPAEGLDPLELVGTIDAQLDLTGTAGTARVASDDGPRVFTDAGALGSVGLWPSVHGRVVGALREELAHFVACAARREPSTLVPLAQSVHAVEIAEAIVRSAETGEAVAP